MSLFLEYCMGERFRATCNDNAVVMVTHAVFGSMRSGRCINNAHPCQQVYNMLKIRIH